MATKPELEKENKALKAEIRELKKNVSKVEEISKGLNNTAIGIALIGEEKKLGMVKIKFDLDKNAAIIDKDSVVVDGVGPITAKARIALVDEIIEQNKKR